MNRPLSGRAEFGVSELVWTAATLQPGGTVKATKNLEAQGFESYTPRHYCHLSRKVMPLFPGYVLVKLGTLFDESIKYTRGIAGVVQMGLIWCVAPDSDIQKIKDLEGPDGLVRLPRMLEQRKFASGGRARLVRGPMSTNHGSLVIFQDYLPEERCSVLLHILGRGVRIVVQEEDLVAA